MHATTRAALWSTLILAIGCRSILGLDPPILIETDARVADGPAVLADARLDSASPADAGNACEMNSAVCTYSGGTCMAGACHITQTNTTPVTCPPDMPCHVFCPSGDDCKDGVDCGNATTCTVSCTGAAACQSGGVDCGNATHCTVRCDGSTACEGTGVDAIECRASICNVTCNGSSACGAGIDVDLGGTCTSHCCLGACSGGTDTCTNDATCL